MSGVTFTNNHRTVRHTVETGETIFSISRKYNVSVEELQRLNGLGTSSGTDIEMFVIRSI